METLEQKQQRITIEIQQTLSAQFPGADLSVGTALYELVVKPAAATYAEQDTLLETVRNNMSLVQVLNQTNPDATLTDNLLSNFNVTRRDGTQAVGLINIYTTSTQPTSIPQTAIFTCGGVTIQPTKSFVGVVGEIAQEDTDAVSYVQAREFSAGVYVFPIQAITQQPTQTVLSPGQTCTSTLTSSFITRTQIGSTFVGGNIEETTVELLERAAVALNSRVLTGRDNIRSFLESNTSINVLDAAVFGMGDDLMLRDKSNTTGLSGGGRVDTYVKTAPVPTSLISSLSGTRVDGVWSVDIPRTLFPGAYGVFQVSYQGNIILADISHVLGYVSTTDSPVMTEPVHARYSAYQTMTIQFVANDIVPDEVTFDVSVFYMPGIDLVQSLLTDPSVKSTAFDMLAKAAIAVIVDVAVDIEYTRGINPPTVGDVQQEVADIINLKLIGTQRLLTSDVVYAIKAIFPAGTVRMPVTLNALIFMPDGSQVRANNTNQIEVLTDTGISPDNASFVCFPSNVDVVLSEVD